MDRAASRTCAARGPTSTRPWPRSRAGEPTLLLTHDPDVFPGVPASVALTLAGHTHGGQIDIPGLAAARSRRGSAIATRTGLIEERGRKLFVTRGVGSSNLPLRFRSPPEVVVLTLEADVP